MFFMIDELKKNLRSQFEGKKISILASGPTLDLFLENEEEIRNENLILGVNGASVILREGDVFISGEEGTHLEPWFYSCPEGVRNIVRACSALYTERFYPDKCERVGLINRFEEFLMVNEKYVKTRWDGIREVIPEEFQNPFDLTLPLPASPHMLLHQVKNMGKSVKLNPHQKYFIIGGTVACIATQAAYHLGAREIHLYGVPFTNESSMKNPPGQNYSQFLGFSRGGYTTPLQREVFDEIISHIHCGRTKVFSHGASRLENTIKLEK